jgi:hypothetical protein
MTPDGTTRVRIAASLVIGVALGCAGRGLFFAPAAAQADAAHDAVLVASVARLETRLVALERIRPTPEAVTTMTPSSGARPGPLLEPRVTALEKTVAQLQKDAVTAPDLKTQLAKLTPLTQHYELLQAFKAHQHHLFEAQAYGIVIGGVTRFVPANGGGNVTLTEGPICSYKPTKPCL